MAKEACWQLWRGASCQRCSSLLTSESNSLCHDSSSADTSVSSRRQTLIVAVGRDVAPKAPAATHQTRVSRQFARGTRQGYERPSCATTGARRVPAGAQLYQAAYGVVCTLPLDYRALHEYNAVRRKGAIQAQKGMLAPAGDARSCAAARPCPKNTVSFLVPQPDSRLSLDTYRLLAGLQKYGQNAPAFKRGMNGPVPCQTGVLAESRDLGGGATPRGHRRR